MQVEWSQTLEESWEIFERSKVERDDDDIDKEKGGDEEQEKGGAPSRKKARTSCVKIEDKKDVGKVDVSMIAKAQKLKTYYDKVFSRAKRIIDSISSQEPGWEWATSQLDEFKAGLARMCDVDDFGKTFLVQELQVVKKQYGDQFGAQCTTFVTHTEQAIKKVEQDAARLTAMQQAFRRHA